MRDDLVVDAVVQALLNSRAEHLHLVCEELGIAETPELCTAVDLEVFCCESCSWWCGRDEESETDGVCDDCAD